MIFIVSTEPFSAVQLQTQLKHTSQNFIEVYLSVEEAEANLYKLPDVILLDQNLQLTNLLYLTQSIKAYDPEIQILWLCSDNAPELHKMYKSYGVTKCVKKNGGLIERLSLIFLEARQQLQRSSISAKRREHLRQSILNSPSDSTFLL